MSAQNQFRGISNFLHSWSETRNLQAVKEFLAHLIRTGLLFLAPNLQSQVILTYTSCQPKNNSQILFDLLKFLSPRNPLPFNSIISYFSRNGNHSLAVRTFYYMHFGGVHIDSYALCSAIASSSSDKHLIFGKTIHAYVKKSGWLSSVFVGSALIDVYAKSSHIGDASKLFDEIPVKNTVCSNALLSGYAEAKMWTEGLELVRRLPALNLECDNFTLSAALRSCTGLSSIRLGKQFHAKILHKIWDLGADVFLQSLLIEMYGKCGHVEKARQVFSTAGLERVGKNKKDVVLWTSMFGVYGKHGNYREVIKLFEEMLMEGIRPDGVAFLAVISACGHTGQVELGLEYFEAMAGRDYATPRSPEHYSCLVDLLCRAGELVKAWELISDIPNEGNGNYRTVSMWGTLLSACNDYGNVDLGKLAAQKALELDPQNTGIYVLLSNMYASHGLWNEIVQLRDLMKGRNLKKDVGRSWTDLSS